jgi:hypothetical protein
MFLQSRLQCVFVLPATADDRHASVTINPGQVAQIEREHFDSVLKGNRALEALVADRKLVPMDSEPRSGDEPQLKKASEPEAPASLRDSVPDVEVKSKVESVSIDLSEPVEAKRRK